MLFRSFVAERDDVPLGTACSCVFGDIAWINYVLVDRAQRGHGVGTALMRHVVRHLDERGIATIRLDATALGQPVYEKLGFIGDFNLTRWAGIFSLLSTEEVTAITHADLPAICLFDECVTRTRREKLLRHLYESNPVTARAFIHDANLGGFCLVRPGANAWQVGPLQGSPQACQALLLDAARRFAGQSVYLDVPTDHAQAVALVQAQGLTPQRSFLRMSRGRPVREDLTRFWTSFGPEKG